MKDSMKIAVRGSGDDVSGRNDEDGLCCRCFKSGIKKLDFEGYRRSLTRCYALERRSTGLPIINPKTIHLLVCG